MRFSKKIGLAVVVGIVLLLGTQVAQAKKIQVVASHMALAELVQAVGGDRVEVHSVSPATQDVHFVEPKPSDVLKISRADLFVHTGLDLELWRGPLVEASGNTRIFPGGPGDVDASQGIALLMVPTRQLSRAEGDIHIFGNTHYWHDPENGRIIAKNVLGKLSQVSPGDRPYFEGNYREFVTSLERKAKELREKLALYVGREIVAYHDSWPYFSRAFGIKINIFLEPKPGITPSGAHLAKVINEMKARNLKIIIIEPHYPKRYAEAVASRTGALIIDFPGVPRAVPGTNSYIAMLEYQVDSLVKAFKQLEAGG